MYINSYNKVLLVSAGLMVSPFTNKFLAQTSRNEKANTPNVIFILADDLGIGDLGCYGQKIIRTPAIDKLAENGMRFTQHYSGSTVSAPSRCSLLTGKHTGHAYIRGNKGYKYSDGKYYDMPLSASEVTVAELMKQKNYQTACIGKWGLGGPASEGHPNNQGFDYFFGYLGQGNAHTYYPDKLFENDKVIPLNKKVYSHDLIMEKALNFVEQSSRKPFFLYLTPTIPHAELIIPEGEFNEYNGKFQETPFIRKGSYCSQEKPKATYAAMVTRLDRDVKRLMDLLERKGILDNTIVIFTSDNGTHQEAGHDPDFFDSNGPFRGNKRDMYEGGIRTPFIVQWPSVVPKGSVSFHISAFWDFLPSMTELIGVKYPSGIDGISYLPQLTGKGKQKQHKSLYFEFHEQGGKQAVLADGWKLIRLNVGKPNKTTIELYNYFHDPSELANVASQHPYIVSKLSKIMDSLRTTNVNWNFLKE
jgi:arylsulfatase A-like enzyme